MKSHEAIQRSVNGKTVDHAKALGISLSSVTKWQEPSTDYTDSGSYNPLDRIESIIEKSLSLGNSPERAYSPIQYLTERFGLIMLHLPKTCKGNVEISRELLKTIKEFGDLAKAASESLNNDGTINKREAEKIDKEAWDLIRQTALFIQTIKESVK